MRVCVRVCVRIRLKSNVTNMSNEIKDFRRKQGDLEFFFLCLVRADNREKFDYLLRYGRTLQLGGEKYARVDEIDLESDIADNADKLDVVMLQVRDDLKSPARIDVFKLPNIKRMLDNGIVSSREVAVLLGVCDSLVSIMTDNKELFKSLVKKYTKQDDSDKETISEGIDIAQIPDKIISLFIPTFKENGILDKSNRVLAKEYLDRVRGCSLSVCATVYNDEYGAKGKAVIGKDWGKKKGFLYDFLLEHNGATKNIEKRTFGNYLN